MRRYRPAGLSCGAEWKQTVGSRARRDETAASRQVSGRASCRTARPAVCWSECDACCPDQPVGRSASPACCWQGPGGLSGRYVAVRRRHSSAACRSDRRTDSERSTVDRLTSAAASECSACDRAVTDARRNVPTTQTASCLCTQYAQRPNWTVKSSLGRLAKFPERQH